jgi:hypothetical protein
MSEANPRNESDPAQPGDFEERISEGLKRAARAIPEVQAQVWTLIQEALTKIEQSGRTDGSSTTVNVPGALTIAEAKAGLALGLGVPESAIEIVVRA